MQLEPFARRLDPGPGRPICVAVSGGGDSILALRQTAVWAHRHGRPVIALHVDHRLQTQSGAFADFTRRAAQALGASCRVLSWDGPKPKTGLAAAARHARHILLAKAAREADASVIVTGHTADDTIENARLGQGALCEWSPSPVWPEGRGLFLLRPLLALRRGEVRAILERDSAAWIDDPSNDNPAQPRIAARRAIAASGEGSPIHPRRGWIAKRGGPGRIATRRAIEVGEPLPDTVLASQVAIDHHAFTVPRRTLLAAPPAAQRRVLAAALVSAGGGERLPRRDSVDRLLNRLATGDWFSATLAGARLQAGETVLITRDAGQIARSGPRSTGAVWDGRYEIDAPGAVIRPLQGFAAALPPAQRSRLRAFPAAVRPGLPAMIVEGVVTCPILAEGLAPGARSLTGTRFLAALGAKPRESVVATPGRMAPEALASYVAGGFGV